MNDFAGSLGGRLAGLAVLPWQCPTEAAVELQRAVGIGLRGAMAYSNVAGRHVDDPDFEPIFAATASLDVPLLLHPAMPLSAPTLGDYGLSCAVGFLFDSTTAILRLILSGLLDRHPGLKIIVGHAGSLLPQLAGRLDLEQARGMIFGAHARRSSLSGDYLRCLYTDTAGGSVPAVASALRLFGSGHVMFGTDFPFWSHDVNLNVLERLPLSSEEMQAVRGQVARELFRLDG